MTTQVATTRTRSTSAKVPTAPLRLDLHLWNRQAIANSVVDGRWFSTGDDLRDADGLAHIVDRVKDVIISHGEDIDPAEVEAAAGALPGVGSAAVVALPDETWGEVGVASVETQPGATHDQLRAHFEAKLAGFKIPRHICFVDELARNATGKFKRVDLRKRARTDVEETP